MRHLDGDERYPCFTVLGGDNRCHVFIGLELDHQVDLLAHQHVRIPLRDLRAVSVVDGNELDALRRRRTLQARRDLLGELVVRPLCRVAEPIGALLEGTQVRSVEILANFLHHPAAFEGVEQAEGHALWQSAPRRDLAQRQRFTR